jgi:hypothetical protein
MSDDRSTITIPRHAFAAVVDAAQRAVIDKGASKATRKAAFSTLLLLLDSGLIRDTSMTSPAVDEDGRPHLHARTGLRLMG